MCMRVVDREITCEIDDVICNVLGAAIGFGLWNMIKGKMHAV